MNVSTPSPSGSPDSAKLAPCIMVVGTGSSVGKSLIVAGLCRYYQRQGLKAAPFKSQNMALNSFVTKDGKEIGTAQAMQAAAAKMEPSVAINPILLKPEGQRRSQVIVGGEAVGSMSATEYHAFKPKLRQVVADALTELRRSHDVVVIEGAGSPVEMNLKSHDIVNMFVAQLAEAKVIIVGDIDKGGIFASLIGTYDLLTPKEQSLVAGFVINKFRGDPALLGDGLDFIKAKTGAPVLGVLPMLEELTLPDEDGHLLKERLRGSEHDPAQLIIGIVSWPRMSNFDEFALLRQTPGITVKLIDTPAEVLACHLLLMPGSKQTISDLLWLRAKGLEPAIKQRFEAHLPILAICGGYQMLGHELVDKLGMESPQPLAEQGAEKAQRAQHPVDGRWQGLGLLPLRTEFARNKTLRQVLWQIRGGSAGLCAGLFGGLAGQYAGYEIHCGKVLPLELDPCSGIAQQQPLEVKAVVKAASDSALPCEAAEKLSMVGGEKQNLFGTLVHGMLNHPEAIACLSRKLRSLYFLPDHDRDLAPSFEQSYEQLADAIEQHLDMTSCLPKGEQPMGRVKDMEL